MEHQWMKWIVWAVMIGIVISLGSGLYFILFQREKPDQAVRALTLRIGLSLFLFMSLFVAFAMGWLKPHGILRTNKQTQTGTTTPHLQNANTMPQPQNQNGGLD